MILILEALQGCSEVFVLLNRSIHTSGERIRPYIKHQNPTLAFMTKKTIHLKFRTLNKNP